MTVSRAPYGALKNDLAFALRCAGTRGIDAGSLAQTIYGEDTKATRDKLHVAMKRLRQRLTIETRTVYVLVDEHRRRVS